MRTRAAKVISVVGHPTLLMPLTVALAGALQNLPASALAAAILWALGEPRVICAGPAAAAGAMLIACAHALRRRLKVSLHSAFASFAALLCWPSWTLTAVMGLLAVAVAWSRLALFRHTPSEVVLGLLMGGTAGVGIHLLPT